MSYLGLRTTAGHSKKMYPKTEGNKITGTRLKKFKNSLDSDEDDDEEEAKKYNILDPENFEGEEEKTVDYDGEIKITPFNMKEELEEGYFDKEGTYIFNKEINAISDKWLDDIDWIKVKTIESVKRKEMDISENDSDEDLPELNAIEHYKKMLDIMQPNESVEKAICRLGGKKSVSQNTSNRWKKKKEENVSLVDEQNREKLQLLTELANEIIQSGDMDIYQQTYEKLSFLVNTSSSQASKTAASYDVDDGMDMFGEKFDEKASAGKKCPRESEGNNQSNSLEESLSNDEVMWDFKWELKDDAEIYGPHCTSEMLRWVQEGYFPDGVFVRQTGKTDRQFYSSKRMDFELYL